MGERLELKFRCKDEEQLDKIIADLQDYFNVPELKSAHYEDTYFLSLGDKDYRVRRNLERDSYQATQKVGVTQVDETSGILLRHEKEADVPMERLSNANENTLVIRKYRRYFTIDEKITVGFDVVENLGCFVEVESTLVEEHTLLKTAKLLTRYNLSPERLSNKTHLLRVQMGDADYYKMYPEYRE